MRHLSWIITVPVALLAISFAVSNREWIDLTIWPLPFALSAPLYLLVLGGLALGFLIGALLTWFGQHGHRRDAKQRAQRIRELTAEVNRYRDREKTVEEESARAREAERIATAESASDRAIALEKPSPARHSH